MRSLAAVLILVLPGLAGAQHTHGPVLGKVDFPNSGAHDAQDAFQTGIALLHSFEYERAEESLRAARAADPSLAVAYWAEALTHSHVLWGTEDLASSRAVLAELGASESDRLAKARTPYERSFGAAVEIFYRDASELERIRAYADAMREHAAQFPEDQEAAAFASHALLLASYDEEGAARRTLAAEAIALAQRVATTNPEHPGATHYLIHLYDTPGLAAQGLDFARAYDRIAPDAEHALHMPSHIYLQLGLWSDVVNSNERAWAASRRENSPDWHAFTWLQYAYLQQGRFAAARALIDSARTILSGFADASPDARFIVARLEFQFASETDEWDLMRTVSAFPPGPPASDRERGYRSMAQYQGVIAAARRGDLDFADRAAPFLETAASVRAGTTPATLAAANALLIEALVAKAAGDTARYIESLERAAEFERSRDAFVGPPERFFALEELASYYIGEGRLEDAARAIEDVLRLCPNRSRNLFGLAILNGMMGRPEALPPIWEKLQVNWAEADPDVKAMLPPGS